MADTTRIIKYRVESLVDRVEEGYIGPAEHLNALRQEIAQVLERAELDEKTGFKRGAELDWVLWHECERSRRSESPLSLIYIDIDDFGNFNNTYGHACGDYVLGEIGKIIRGTIRSIDEVYRIGGDESAILCPTTHIGGALQLAEHLRKKIGDHSFQFKGQELNITISCGVAQYSPETKKEQLAYNADQALYATKAKGRNQVTGYVLGTKLEEICSGEFLNYTRLIKTKNYS